jgi:hypothetical protein
MGGQSWDVDHDFITFWWEGPCGACEWALFWFSRAMITPLVLAKDATRPLDPSGKICDSDGLRLEQIEVVINLLYYVSRR